MSVDNRMGPICRRLLTECVLLDIRTESKEELVSMLVAAIARAHTVSDEQLLVRDVLEREELASTCIGLGCAVPHAHSAAIDTTIIAAARLKPPFGDNTPDSRPVELVFLMAGPENSAGLHLRLLSRLARLLHNDSFRGALMQAESGEEFRNLICEEDL